MDTLLAFFMTQLCVCSNSCSFWTGLDYLKFLNAGKTSECGEVLEQAAQGGDGGSISGAV